MKLQITSMLRFSIGCACLLLLEVGFVSVAFAQFSQLQQALDPDCYFPRVGVPGEIDTIYGSVAYQWLGNGLTSLGPAPGGVFNRVAFEGYAPIADSNLRSTNYDVFQGGPNFQLNALQSISKTNVDLKYCQFAHLRSKQYLDAVKQGETGDELMVYWSDADGNYDTARKTILWGGTRQNPFFFSDGPPVVGSFSHDTTDDLLMLFDSFTTPTKTYLCWFNGQSIFGKDTAWADSTFYFDTTTKSDIRMGITGDFTGSGRTSFIGCDPGYNVYFFANDLPFYPSKFIHAMKYDTLWTHWQNPQLNLGPFAGVFLNGIAMQAFPKSTGDKSVDFLTLQQDNLDSANGKPQHIYFFKGGPEFGTKRLFLDSADFLFHTPAEYTGLNGLLNAEGIVDCGDITGTGNRVLFLECSESSLYDYNFYYVTGKALDDKADMLYEVDPYGSGATDTITSDDGGLHDLMGASPEYYSYDDLTNHNKIIVGSVYLLHGSPKIPVHINGRFDVKQEQHASERLEIYPNPANTNTSLVLRGNENKKLSIVLLDVLGREISRSEHRCTTNAEIVSIPLKGVSPGTYVIEVLGGVKPQTSKIVIVR